MGFTGHLDLRIKHCYSADIDSLGITGNLGLRIKHFDLGLRMKHCCSTEMDSLKQNLVAVNTAVEHIFHNISFAALSLIPEIKSHDVVSRIFKTYSMDTERIRKIEGILERRLEVRKLQVATMCSSCELFKPLRKPRATVISR